ncbi:hypothetical protein AAMO2058_000353800 [Amorphochlora amoebiformis]
MAAEPRAFVNWQAVQKILEAETTVDVAATLLFSAEGELLTTAGEETHEDIVSALMAGIWNSYDDLQRGLKFLLLECEEGKLGITAVGRFRICMYSNSFNYPIGLLKAKVIRIASKLNKPLSSVY